MRYLLGVDVGASKTHALISDEAGHAIGFGRAGPGNHQVVGYEGLQRALQIAVAESLGAAGLGVHEITGAAFGIGGYDWPTQLEDHLKAIAALSLRCMPEVTNDSIIGLLAGASKGWGVVLIAGSGGNVRGRDESGREARTTGEGQRFGEFGGAGDLVERAFHAVCHEWSGGGQKTALTSMFLSLTGAADLDDLIEGIDFNRYHLDHAWAPKVFRAAQEGDPAARTVIEEAGRQLGGDACGVIRKLGIEDRSFEVVMAGGLFSGGDLFIEPVRATILEAAPKAEFVKLKVPPVVGAVLLAAPKTGVAPAAMRDRLIESTSELLEKSAT